MLQFHCIFQINLLSCGLYIIIFSPLTANEREREREREMFNPNKYMFIIVAFIVLGNGIGDQNSNPGQGCLHFTFVLMYKERVWIHYFSSQLLVINVVA